MTCPRCNKPLEISADGTRGYCLRSYCHAMVKLDDSLYGLADWVNCRERHDEYLYKGSR